MREAYEKLFQALNEGSEAAMLTVVNNLDQQASKVTKKCYVNKEHDKDEDPFNALIQRAYEQRMVEVVDQVHQTIIIEPYFPVPQLVILGGGHIAKPLTTMAAQAGFQVTVVDDRLSFANQKRFPEAQQVICESFSTCFQRLDITSVTYVVIVTRGHRHDLECLRAVIDKGQAYVGMIGSKRRVKGILEELEREGYSKELLEKVHTPIGLDIGAVTPEEIALSIAAELVSCRRLIVEGREKKAIARNQTEYDPQVVKTLSLNQGEKKAVVTVIATKGSVPRKAGAKMIVFPDGSIAGSIGGGCSESQVIQWAIDSMDSHQVTIRTLDLTGEMAEDMGMVCGGIMSVLIEPFVTESSRN
ncbi:MULTISPECIES: XdhC family protein [Anoxynatronum]|uniref:Xanthine dehydrogenase accessory factor n=2 Tax=Anoxynatronum TaxID=210622 RepID=A0AA45WTP5_9CLOT|nr:XdhC/CoxI family protein [Anoxynatronum buryatiense]SMP39968.1 xanthine dehydrogenase accessory factor [Anoxynatronum buryatiense]